ncbi:MAG: hypothetical protein VKO39_12180 [Cyanobacteriota bacterium]|nr:hypothetical protein [Cyanobacteriota bacterium]
MSATAPERHRYGMAPVIRYTLWALYASLVLPLPLVAPAGLRAWLWGALVLGWIAVVALTSEQVVVDDAGLSVGHPPWCTRLLRRGWQLAWNQVAGLTPVATSQGGRVFYVRAKGEARAYLLPQRVERFDDFLRRFSALSGVSTAEVARITPPWTYQLLAVLSVSLLAAEAWALTVQH